MALLSCLLKTSMETGSKSDVLKANASGNQNRDRLSAGITQTPESTTEMARRQGHVHLESNQWCSRVHGGMLLPPQEKGFYPIEQVKDNGGDQRRDHN